MEFDWSHSEKVQPRHLQAVFKVDSTESSRETTDEHVKVTGKLKTAWAEMEKGSRSCGVAGYCGRPMFLELDLKAKNMQN